MDQYQRVEKPREETPINENEIRITAQGRMHSYITYASTLLQEKGSNDIVFKAMGRAINKTVMIVELIKRRIVGLHQITAIGSTDRTDTWEPLEEGLLPLETTRHVSMITITLSKTELDKANVGYQFSLPADQVKPWGEFDYEGEAPPALRGRGRGGWGRARGMSKEEDDKAKIVKAIYKIQAQGDDDDEDDAYLIDPIDFNRKLTFNLSRNHDDDVALVAEKGPVALRDFPHPRHLCANFPVNTTSHESYCSQCFCYVCDIAAPCLQWTGTSGHCNVSKKPL